MARGDTSAPPVAFAASGRVAQLEAMAAAPLDVLVIGGGITGVGVALDAVTRGLRVGIVERDDWACGTSSRSSKMIHGGLRYLASGDVKVVRESLRERSRIQRNAEHLVRPLPMLLPTYGHGPMPLQRLKLGAGLWVYEALGHRKAAGSLHQWLDVGEFTRLVPGVSIGPRGRTPFRGAHHYHDASADDVRLVLAVLRTAVANGALAVNGAPVTRLLREGERVVGAAIGGDAAAQAAQSTPEAGSSDGSELELRARVVVNATGVWADETLRAGAGDAPVGFRVLPSKGIHLAVRRDRVGIDSGIAFFGQTDNSNVFIEPWQEDLAFIGTTDAPYDGDLVRPEATLDEIDWLLDRVNPFLRTPIGHEDVLATWAGLRPLVGPDAEGGTKSEDVSRRHLLVDRAGCVTITGGKLTAYRSMAELAVDAAMAQLGRRGKSRTRELRLEGSRPMPSSAEIDDVCAQLGVERSDARHLLRRHGTNVPHLLELVRQRPELAERLHPDRPYLAVEAAWAASHEQARDVEDVLHRRTRLALETRDPERASDVVAAELAAVVGAHAS
ncbi:MAG: glpD 2 [Thermoleophilia bacterium]|nr:glpD 2 [Thermoleophilia bacterium]